MRWSQGRWSEDLLIGAVNMTERYFALPYGPSSAAPDDDVRAFELYFERLDRAGLGSLKRPDLLVFPSSERSSVEAAVGQVGGVGELPFTPEDASAIQALLARSVLAVECENSLWKCRQMPDFGADLRPQRRPDAPPPSPETPPTYRPFSVPGRRKPHPQHPEHAKPGRRSAAGARRGRASGTREARAPIGRRCAQGPGAFGTNRPLTPPSMTDRLVHPRGLTHSAERASSQDWRVPSP